MLPRSWLFSTSVYGPTRRAAHAVSAFSACGCLPTATGAVDRSRPSLRFWIFFVYSDQNLKMVMAGAPAGRYSDPSAEALSPNGPGPADHHPPPSFPQEVVHVLPRPQPLPALRRHRVPGVLSRGRDPLRAVLAAAGAAVLCGSVPPCCCRDRFHFILVCPAWCLQLNPFLPSAAGLAATGAHAGPHVFPPPSRHAPEVLCPSIMQPCPALGGFVCAVPGEPLFFRDHAGEAAGAGGTCRCMRCAQPLVFRFSDDVLRYVLSYLGPPDLGNAFGCAGERYWRFWGVGGGPAGWGACCVHTHRPVACFSSVLLPPYRKTTPGH